MGREKAVLYLGFDAKHFKTEKPIIHMPLVEIHPRPIDSMEIKKIFSQIPNYTHIIFTSKKSVNIFFEYLDQYGFTRNVLKKTHIIAMGQVTAFYIKEAGLVPTYIASDETQEGIIHTLAHFDLDRANLLLPRSSAARPLLSQYLVEHRIRYQICTLYDMSKIRPKQIVDLNEVDEIVFTNPISVDSFFELYEEIPSHIKLHPLGSITREKLRCVLHVHGSALSGAIEEKTAAFAC